jgi:bacterioferritin
MRALRELHQLHISEGVVTPAYRGDVYRTINILQTVLATEVVCVLRYTMHSIAATGISLEGVKAEFAEHAREEQEHMNAVTERIN